MDDGLLLSLNFLKIVLKELIVQCFSLQRRVIGLDVEDSCAKKKKNTIKLTEIF